MMRAISQAVPRPIDFLVVGVAKRERISRVLREFKRSTIVTDQPIIKALKGQQTLHDLEHIKAAPSVVRDESLAVKNMECFLNYCESIRRYSFIVSDSRFATNAPRIESKDLAAKQSRTGRS